MASLPDNLKREESLDFYCVVNSSGIVVFPLDAKDRPSYSDAEKFAASLPGSTIQKTMTFTT